MQSKQKTISKVKGAAKVSSKTKGAAVAKVDPRPYATLLGDALNGILGATVKMFYVNAGKYHKTSGKTFPRPDYATVPLLPIDKARETLADFGKRNANIPNGAGWSRRLYDEMRVQAAQGVEATK